MSLSDTSEMNLSSDWDSLTDGVRSELEQAQRELKDIGRMLEQSQGEVDKLAQRNATITMHLQQVQNQVDTIPVNDLQTAYEAALDAQQRLVVMRSQLEKLQSEQNHIEKYIALLKNVQKNIQGGQPEAGSSNGNAGAFATAEMMIQSQEAERQRLSRQMHDGPAQTLSNFILQTEIAMKLFEVDQDKAREELTSLKSSASSAFKMVRNFISDLRPMMLDDLGLAPTARKYIEEFREKSGLETSITVTGQERRLESYMEVMIFRSMQELLNNSSLHSQATQVKVHLDMSPELIKLVVEDNGKGFDPESLIFDAGLGIKLIQERAEMLGGRFEMDSSVGQGARFTLSLPPDEQKEG